MAKIFGVLLIVLGVWLGMEIYTKGMDKAFGGALAGWSEPAPEREPLAKRMSNSVQESLDQSAAHGEVDGGADPDDDN
jgi:hypothetical protein